MILALPIFAAGLDEVLPVLIVIVIMIVSAVAQLMGKIGQARPPQGQPPNPRAPKPAGDLMDEIGEFLRRAAEAGQQEQRQRGSRQNQPKPVVRAAEPIIVAEPAIRAEVVPSSASSTQALGASVAGADDAIDAHLRQTFDHKIGSFGESAKAATADLGTTAALIEDASVDVSALLAMLADPEGVRNAIVLGEILARPEHRWA